MIVAVSEDLLQKSVFTSCATGASASLPSPCQKFVSLSVASVSVPLASISLSLASFAVHSTWSSVFAAYATVSFSFRVPDILLVLCISIFHICIP